MNIENLKILIDKLKEKKGFDWSNNKNCLESLIPATYAGLGEFLNISSDEADILYVAGYRFDFNVDSFEQLRRLKKSAAMRLLKTCLKLKKVPSMLEFKFVESDYRKR